MNNRKLIFGLGTGRCGSWSLTKLLQKQTDTYAFHELNYLPWEFDEEALKGNINHLLSRPEKIVGDVGFYYLNYVDYIIEKFPEAKFVYLYRDVKEVVNSWMKHSGNANHWTDPSSSHWDSLGVFTNTSKYFPKYNLPKEKAIKEHWTICLHKAINLWNKYPSKFFVFRAKNVLNESIEQLVMLSCLGIKSPRCSTEHHNKTGEPLIVHEKMATPLGDCEFCNKKDSATWNVIDKRKGQYSYACNECKQGNKLGNLNQT